MKTYVNTIIPAFLFTSTRS